MSKILKIDQTNLRAVMRCMSKMSKMGKEHTNTFLLLTFLIFNQFSIRKKFWKAETKSFSTIPSLLYISILSILDISISNAFNTIYVEAVDTFSTQYTHMQWYACR